MTLEDKLKETTVLFMKKIVSGSKEILAYYLPEKNVLYTTNQGGYLRTIERIYHTLTHENKRFYELSMQDQRLLYELYESKKELIKKNTTSLYILQ